MTRDERAASILQRKAAHHHFMGEHYFGCIAEAKADPDIRPSMVAYYEERVITQQREGAEASAMARELIGA